MAGAKDAGQKGDGGLMTLTEVSKRAKISMPTLQRYKKEYQARIPSVGKGRKQRYPEEALAVFEEIKKENLARRGRPPKKKAAASKGRSKAKAQGAKSRRAPKKSTRTRKAASPSAQPAEEGQEAMSLLQISKQTGIEYTKLQRLVKKYMDEIPHVGKGRTRRYLAGAVDKLQELSTGVQKTVRSRVAKAKKAVQKKAAETGVDEEGLKRKLASLEKAHEQLKKDYDQLSKDVKSLTRNLKKSIKITLLD